jgi:hypothetical protein
MALHVMAPFVPRARRAAAMMIPILVVASAVGCGHRRQSMRPVYVTPAPAAVAVPSAGCPSGNCGTTGEPALSEPAAAAPASPTATIGPATPPLDAPVAPAGTSPPRPGQPEEPALDPVPANPSTVPNLNGPASQNNSGPALRKTLRSGRRGLLGRPRQASLQDGLRPFVDNPEDLFSPPKADRPWKYVVLHHSATPSGGYDEIDREHRKVLGWSGCAYHFVIGNGTGSPDGQIEVAQRWVEQKHGVHCRDARVADVNEYGIGICLVGDLDKAPPTPRQVAAAKALVAYLGDRYEIPAEHIGPHAQLAGSAAACPGKNFPAQAILGSRNLAQR